MGCFVILNVVKYLLLNCIDHETLRYTQGDKFGDLSLAV